MRALILILSIAMILMACEESENTTPLTPTVTLTSEGPAWTEHQAINVVLRHILRGLPIQYEEQVPMIDYTECFYNKAGEYTGLSSECADEVSDRWRLEGSPTQTVLWSEDQECPEWDPRYKGYVPWHAEYHPLKTKEELMEASPLIAAEYPELFEDEPLHWRVTGFADGCVWSVYEDSGIYDVGESEGI